MQYLAFFSFTIIANCRICLSLFYHREFKKFKERALIQKNLNKII